MPDLAKISFNPCFIGNCSHTYLEDFLMMLLYCFNPCFIGNCSHTANIFATRIASERFQSLFYWKLLSYFIDMGIDLSDFEERFNPCFIGNCSHTVPPPDPPPKVSSFNPCFIGNCSHTHETCFVHKAPEPFQSLFYWKLLSYEKSCSKKSETKCFNPCFIGNCSHTGQCYPISKISQTRFNPCFIGNCSHTLMACLTI